MTPQAPRSEVVHSHEDSKAFGLLDLHARAWLHLLCRPPVGAQLGELIEQVERAVGFVVHRVRTQYPTIRACRIRGVHDYDASTVRSEVQPQPPMGPAGARLR